jgi:glycosyltransferase involved in cell wall biosynthesis
MMSKTSDQIGIAPVPVTSTVGLLAGKRILVVMPSIPLYGMERKNLQIMKEMREQGADVLFITQETYGGNIRREVERIGCRWTTASFEKLLHLSKDPREMIAVLRAWMKSAWQLWRIYRQYQPTHIHITNLTYFLYAWPVVAWLPRPVIFALPVPPDTNLSPFKQRLSNFIWRIGVQRACDLLVCNSKYTFSEVIKIGIDPEKTRVLYNTAPERAIPIQSDAPVVDTDKFNIVYMGRICADKGIRELIDAAFQIIGERADVDFYLAGDYSWKNPFADEIIRAVQERRLESRIHFLGEVEDITSLLAQCHLHVCPSTWDEPFGLVVLEAKQHGLPSVVFPSGGLVETVSHHQDGYICDSKTGNSLYKGLRYYIDNPEALRQAGDAARASLARFSKEQNARDWIAIFQSDNGRHTS